jgi:hypothetical protein
MMAFMSEETRDRLIRASRNYRRLKLQLDGARGELADAIVAMRLEGALIEDITAVVPYRQTQVNRILKTAGLVQERHRASPVEAA